MSEEKVYTLEGFNPGTEASFSDLLSKQELAEVLSELIASDDISQYIDKYYSKTVIDGSVVYYVC